jgi:hypothetical protein
MRLPPIRPPARTPAAWLRRPELAPPRRSANHAFKTGAVLAGLHTRFPVHPVCGARTKRGTLCKAPKVAGANRCRYHGGGQVLLLRARETLARTRSRSVMAKCIWHLEKAHRNRIRRHLKAGEHQLVEREMEAEQANQLISSAIREGWVTPDLVRCLYRAGDEACHPSISSLTSGIPV